ncbi:hypothetical protein BBO99_00006910 [Phytophthora kernoviae]|uniref:Selenoprotein K n=2 Tax=Phytophthora kernoviae TaxID=325452 RepID=A0A3R7GUH9_9STRA|nr:hypothetical protein G195_007779 [Phytophthora kernoviae 00238/432]KAG2520553.1 hypothetical protein JM16_006674 [Phytophthora kernoviae]KAG2522217.1 hypothetical protein JM18_006257 [Phytophthora kernoviae]RLN44097.1 hypothetical protein BBI17_007010 [Phytophthora kernoviae]RLN77243.1 hypothetical protein BBO99_00006910 [Phytophthora kernoviae]
MTYVSGGDVVAKRSPWRLTIMSDMFWGVVNFVGLFVSSIFSDPSTATRGNSNIPQGSSSSGRGLGGNGGSRRPMGRVNHQGTINMPMGGGCCG